MGVLSFVITFFIVVVIVIMMFLVVAVVADLLPCLLLSLWGAKSRKKSGRIAEENMRKLGGRIECGRSCLYVLFLLLLFLFLCLALPRILLVALDATLVVICDVAAVFFRFSG